MKNILCANMVFFAVVALFPFNYSHAESTHQLCNSVSGFGKSIMEFRQEGGDISEIVEEMEELLSNQEFESEFQEKLMDKWFKEIIFQAYEEPLQESFTKKKLSIKEFGNSVYVMCQRIYEELERED